MVGIFVLAVAIAVGVGLWLGQVWFTIPLGIMAGLLGGFILFGRRVQRRSSPKAEGQPGAAGWALGNMRGTVADQTGRRRYHHLDAVPA